MKSETIKIKNTTGNALELFNPIEQTFHPGVAVVVTYNVGKALMDSGKFEEVKEKEFKKKSKKVK